MEKIRYLTLDGNGNIRYAGIVQVVDEVEAGFMLRATASASTIEELEAKMSNLVETIKGKKDEVKSARVKISKKLEIEEVE
jgi:hypothetical protein